MNAGGAERRNMEEEEAGKTLWGSSGRESGVSVFVAGEIKPRIAV